MADPLSVAAGMVTVIAAAIQSAQSLYDTVKSFEGRDRTLRRLQNELQDLTNVLGLLADKTSAETPLFELLQTPIYRCSQLCGEFKESMEAFLRNPTMDIRSWAKMQHIGDDINVFIDIVAEYKSTIAIVLGAITMDTTAVSRQILQEYNELIQDTRYNLEINLQRLEERPNRGFIDSTDTSDNSIDVNDEKAVTKQCLRLCEDVRFLVESRSNRKSFLIQERPQNTMEDDMQSCFEAQVLTRQALEGSLDNFRQVIDRLQKRLESLATYGNTGEDKAFLWLHDDIETSKQCLEVCRAARELSRQKIHRTLETAADRESDQVVVTTLGELFNNAKGTLFRNDSAQLVGSMTEESLRHLASKRFEDFPVGFKPTEACSTNLPSAIKTRPSGSINGIFQKVQAASSSDEGLLKECQEKVPCKNCDRITWSEPGRGNRVDPPSNTMAVVVDLISARGAIRVYDQQGSYVDGVGSEDAGSRIIVPWDVNWWFYVSGCLTVGFVLDAS